MDKPKIDILAYIAVSIFLIASIVVIASIYKLFNLFQPFDFIIPIYLTRPFDLIDPFYLNIIIILLISVILALIIYLLLPRNSESLKKLPTWISIILIIASIILIQYFGKNINLKSNDNMTQENFTKEEREFIQLFNALEVQNNPQNYFSKNLDNSQKLTYFDYIILKFQLWKPEKLSEYHKMKQEYSIDPDKWNALLLAAQNYRGEQDWKKKSLYIEKFSKKEYLKYLETYDNESYQKIKQMKSSNFINEIDKDKNLSEKIISAMYPDSDFSEIEMKNKIENIKKNWKDVSKDLYDQFILNEMRKKFEENYFKEK